MRGQSLKGHLDLLLLSVIATGPKHGYAVMEALRLASSEAFDLAEGTIYPALNRLERDGLLGSEWSEVQGRRRRTYHLTASGRKALTEQRGAWEAFSAAINQVVGGAPWPATS
ncbi:MAG: helix-turn-helix transcriptional regulator [Acidimicrobiales bacterium]